MKKCKISTLFSQMKKKIMQTFNDRSCLAWSRFGGNLFKIEWRSTASTQFHNAVCTGMQISQKEKWVATQTIPDFFFLSVGAGAGKSYLVIAIIKYLTRLLRYPNQTLDQPFVLWLHLLKKLLQVLNGITLHFTFHPPVKSGLKPYGSKKQMPVFKSFDNWWNVNDRKGNLWIFIKI